MKLENEGAGQIVVGPAGFDRFRTVDTGNHMVARGCALGGQSEGASTC